MNFANQLLFCNNSLITIYDDENLIFLIVKCRPTFMAPSDTTRATVVKRLMPFAESEIEIAEGRERERERVKKLALFEEGHIDHEFAKLKRTFFANFCPQTRLRSTRVDTHMHAHARTHSHIYIV